MHDNMDFSKLIPLAGRWDIYGPVHKGLRLAQSRMLARLGNADHADALATALLLADLRELLHLAASHVAHEEDHIHRALAEHAPDAVSRLAHDHDEHLVRFAELEKLVAAVEKADDRERAMRGRALYLAFCAYCAEDLEHMNAEESIAWPILCEIFTDEQLMAIEMGIIGSLTPETSMAFMRLMIPAMSPAERAGMLQGMRASAPAEAFEAVIEFAARPTLPADDFRRLAADIGLAA